MHYESGMGSYCNDFMESIAGTEVRSNIPYKIDKAMYDDILKKHNECSRFKNTDVVSFSMDYNFRSSSKGEDGETPYMYGFFVWPKNTPDGSDDFYDCILFDDYKYDNKHKEAYENFVNELFGCIKGVDVPTAMAMKQEMVSEIKTKLNDLDNFDAVIQTANKQ